MKQNQLDQKAMELQAQEDGARRAVSTATKEFNLRQAEERKQRENDEKEAQLQAPVIPAYIRALLHTRQFR